MAEARAGCDVTRRPHRVGRRRREVEAATNSPMWRHPRRRRRADRLRAGRVTADPPRLRRRGRRPRTDRGRCPIRA